MNITFQKKFNYCSKQALILFLKIFLAMLGIAALISIFAVSIYKFHQGIPPRYRCKYTGEVVNNNTLYGYRFDCLVNGQIVSKVGDQAYCEEIDCIIKLDRSCDNHTHVVLYEENCNFSYVGGIAIATIIFAILLVLAITFLITKTLGYF